MKSIFLALLSFVFILAGCSGDSHADYVGVWQTTGKPLKTYEVRKDGENYFLQDLRATKMNGEKQGPMPLTVKDGRLVWSSGFGELPLVLSADRGTLVFSDLSLARVADGQGLKQAIETEGTQRIANREKCQELGKEMKAKDNAINASGSPGAAKMADKAALKAEMNQRASAIPDCNAMLLLY